MADNDIQDYDDLKGLDLSKLDLDDIELDEEGPSVVLRILALLLLLGLGAFLLWFPTSDTYLSMGQTNWVFFVLCGVAVVVGIGVGRWLWNWVLDAAARYAARRAREERRTKEPPKPPSAFARWATLLLVLGGVGVILFGLPAWGVMQGQGAGSLWFGVAIVAIIVGFLAGRWLLMQAEAAIKARPKGPPIQLPGWFKWVTLVVLVGAGLFALIYPAMSSGGDVDSTIRFSLGMVGLVVGVVGAIWLTRRFDESEAKIRARMERSRARPQP